MQCVFVLLTFFWSVLLLCDNFWPQSNAGISTTTCSKKRKVMMSMNPSQPVPGSVSLRVLPFQRRQKATSKVCQIINSHQIDGPWTLNPIGTTSITNLEHFNHLLHLLQPRLGKSVKSKLYSATVGIETADFEPGEAITDPEEDAARELKEDSMPLLKIKKFQRWNTKYRCHQEVFLSNQVNLPARPSSEWKIV